MSNIINLICVFLKLTLILGYEGFVKKKICIAREKCPCASYVDVSTVKDQTVDVAKAKQSSELEVSHLKLAKIVRQIKDEVNI